MTTSRERLRLVLAIMRRAAGPCLLLVMSACSEGRPTAPTVPTVPSPAVAPTFTLSGVITERFSGRPVQKANVWVWPLPSAHVRSWPPGGLRMTPSDRDGRYIISGLPSVGPLWVSAGPASARLQRPVRAPVRGDGNGRGRRDVGRDRLFYDGSRRAQRVHGSNLTKFANRLWHGVRNHRKRPAAGQKRLGRVGSGFGIGRPFHGRDDN